jgi:catechol 2,3-dioxygenase-like lactoylglutathione lyase family enzyme
MYDHIGLQVHDLAASVRFYEAVLTPLGFGLCTRDDASAGFGPADAAFVRDPDGNNVEAVCGAAP